VGDEGDHRRAAGLRAERVHAHDARRLNDRDDATEPGRPVPEEPILFTTSPNTQVGPDDGVRIPRGATTPDGEVELGIVIGPRTSYLEPSRRPATPSPATRSSTTSVTAREVAHAVASLASPAAASTTGAVLRADGGMTALRL
jgi:NAD(P)-dependent dehydrogenase (short-subunit alcohol dehydrogenase family)